MKTDPKHDLRKRAYAARKTAHATAGPAPEAATRHLLTEIGPVPGCVLSGYMPIRTEIDPRPAMAALHAAKARVCVPVIMDKGQPLAFREWTPDCALIEGAFGALVPETGDWLVPEVLIVPLVGFDHALNRLGYGGGFYDRTLEALRKTGPTRAVGFAYGDQQMPPLPIEPTDQPLEAIVTERGVIRS